MNDSLETARDIFSKIQAILETRVDGKMGRLMPIQFNGPDGVEVLKKKPFTVIFRYCASQHVVVGIRPVFRKLFANVPCKLVEAEPGLMAVWPARCNKYTQVGLMVHSVYKFFWDGANIFPDTKSTVALYQPDEAIVADELSHSVPDWVHPEKWSYSNIKPLTGELITECNSPGRCLRAEFQMFEKTPGVVLLQDNPPHFGVFYKQDAGTFSSTLDTTLGTGVYIIV